MPKKMVPKGGGDGTDRSVCKVQTDGQRDKRSNSQEAGDDDLGVPSREKCKRAIGSLPGLVAMKVLTPSQSNAIRAAYETLLKEHDKSQYGQQAQLSDEDVMNIYRMEPKLVSLIEPLLTTDQVNMVMTGGNVEE